MGIIFASRPVTVAAYQTSRSLRFVTNAAADHEYTEMVTIPDGFGDGEFTFEFWLKLDSATISSFSDLSAAQLTDWWAGDTAPYDNSDWWFRGNFLIDGHNNTNFFSGTFSIQIIGGGRVRWLFGDGAAADARLGDLHAVQAVPSSSVSSLIANGWHKVSCVRRNDGGSGSILELWVDGALIASETSTARTNMATTYWDSWSGYPANQDGWFFGAEKQAAIISGRNQYEDYKGLISETSFWSRAKSSSELTNDWNRATQIGESGLVGIYRYLEQTGSVANDSVASVDMTLINQQAGGMWDSAGAV